MSRIDV